MRPTFKCGDPLALVSYLYDECAPQERHAISAHVAVCEACADEIASLSSTRERLGEWHPPHAQLGFRVVPAESTVLKPVQWWRRPMPVWAQTAAAVVVFATGLSLGARLEQAAPSQGVPRAAVTTPAVTAGDLSALERRLRAEISQLHDVAAGQPAAATDAHLLDRVRTLIQDSEQRQQRELALRTAEVVRDFDAQRRVDLTRIERTLGQMDGTTGVEVEQQRQMLNYLMRVSQRGQ